MLEAAFARSLLFFAVSVYPADDFTDLRFRLLAVLLFGFFFLFRRRRRRPSGVTESKAVSIIGEGIGFTSV